MGNNVIGNMLDFDSGIPGSSPGSPATKVDMNEFKDEFKDDHKNGYKNSYFAGAGEGLQLGFEDAIDKMLEICKIEYLDPFYHTIDDGPANLEGIEIVWDKIIELYINETGGNDGFKEMDKKKMLQKKRNK